MAKVYDSQSGRVAILGVPDVNGGQNTADVDSSSRLQVALGTSTGGTLNATGQVSITGSATLIIAAATRQAVLVTNPSSTVTVFIGGSGVTTGNGQELLPLQSLTLPVVSAVYGIVTTGSQTVSYVEVI
jgi:hypothetical protein